MNSSNLSGKERHPDTLTWREQDILILLADRLTNREIADRLHLAESTVKDYVGKILSKLYVKNRREAVEKAKTLGLLEQGQELAPTSHPNLPPETTPFVGRKTELGNIYEQLVETRLLTLTGPGGIGKTRLALKTAAEMGDQFKDGCFFISLSPLRSVDQLVQAIAEGIKYPIATQEDPLKQLLRYLRSRQLLLVMDNFEHILEGADIVNLILQEASGVKILATSRERLNLHSETIFNIRGMDIPEIKDFETLKNNEAVILFIQSANKVQPGFDPTPDELNRIRMICQFVGGMPLAIELAAAWLHILTVDEITAEIEKDLDILSTELRDTPERHRSIRSIFDHSWSMLDRKEQEIFTRLSLFRGGFTREAAEQIAGAKLPQLVGLVDKSLLSHVPENGRLEIHELLRQFAQEQLERDPVVAHAAQESHAEYYAEFMACEWDHMRSSQQKESLKRIEADLENVRVAWRFYLAQKNSTKLWNFIYALWYLYWIRWWNHAGMLLFQDAAAELEGSDDNESITLRLLALSFQSYFMAWLGSASEGYKIAGECVSHLEELDHPRALIRALYSLTVNSYFLYLYEEEVVACNRMVKIASELEDKWLLAYVLFARGLAMIATENFSEAKETAITNLALFDELGDTIGTTLPLIVLGHAALGLGELDEARGLYLRCLKISQDTDFYYSMQTVSKYLAKVALNQGRLAEAEDYLRQSLTITSEIGFVRDVVNLIFEYARLFVSKNTPEKAISLLALVIEHPASDLYRMLDGRIKDSATKLLESLEENVAPDIYKRAMEYGQSLDLDEVTVSLIRGNYHQEIEGQD